ARETYSKGRYSLLGRRPEEFQYFCLLLREEMMPNEGLQRSDAPLCSRTLRVIRQRLLHRLGRSGGSVAKFVLEGITEDPAHHWLLKCQTVRHNTATLFRNPNALRSSKA